MSYSAKVGDIDRFDIDIIAMGSRRRAEAESERKALVNSDKYAESGPRLLNGGMDTNDKLRVVAAEKIEKMYSTAPIKTRAVPTATNHAKTAVVIPETAKKGESVMRTRQMPTQTANAVKTVEIKTAQPQHTPRKRTKVYNAKRTAPTIIQTRKDNNKAPVPMGAVSAILILTILLLYFIVLFIQSFELEDGIAQKKRELSEKLMTQSTWETKLEEKNPSLDVIEKFASDNGMIRKTPNKYISITPEEDVIEIYDKE